MIRAMIFDLDGTLVQTEKLKALSYARAAVELCPEALSAEPVIEAFKKVVGRSRREVAITLMRKFGLTQAAGARMNEFGVSAPWQALVQVRLGIYQRMLADPAVLRANQWPHTVALLQKARQYGCQTALATMSYCPQVRRVLQILHLTDAFDVVASRDDVEHGKPNPEIYQLVAEELELVPSQCLVIEDSLPGVQAALAAGMRCIAVATDFTRAALHRGRLLDEGWIVDDPAQLAETVQRLLHQRS